MIRLSVKLGLLLVLLGIAVGLWLKNTSAEHFPIRFVRVEGQFTYSDHKRIQATLLPFMSSGFVHLKVNALQHQLQSLSWIDTINIYRIWPDSVLVRFTEKKAVAMWRDKALVSTQAKLFYPEKTIASNHLPHLHGPQGEFETVFKQFNKVQILLNTLGLKVEKMELSSRLAWRLKLDNGMVLLLGSTDVLTRLTHFVKAYDRVFSNQVKAVNYVDLRYPSGLAVNWKHQH